ncbi:MAG: immunoglobulin domain-containing protein [Phycisphaerae bacterium]
MIMRATPIHIVAPALCAIFWPEAARTEELAGGGGGVPAYRQCISTSERDGIARELAALERSFGPPSHAGSGGAPPPLTFFPMAGNLWGDLFTFNNVDLDPTIGPLNILDWDCTDWTYDGHNGNDTLLRSFGEQVIGVPVFAAQDGMVVLTHDGEFDMNTVWAGQVSNLVIIDHGFGRAGYYFHLKQWSVAVSEGEQVRAGQQVGLAASSGVSSAPHLHFEIRDSGYVFEPFAGDCRPGSSGWVDQPPIDRSMYLQDFGIAFQNITQPWPYERPRTGQIALSDPVVRVWFYGTALPVNSGYRVRFRRPDGTIAHQELRSFGNPVFWRWFDWYWTYDVADMHSITGTWHVLLDINGEPMIEAPIEVREERTDDFNRPPEPITVAFDPALPLVGGVQVCRVNTSLTLDDMDYDIVRYEYVWTVDGQEVRHVTTAGQSDVLPHHVVAAGETLECTVTPRDGMAAGPTAQVSAVVGCSHTLDFACDGDVDLTDYAQFFGCVSGPDGSVGAPCAPADADGDGDVDLFDLGTLMRRFNGDCGVRVTEHPVDATVCTGEPVAFHATVDAQDPVYEWRRNGMPVPGATGDTLVIDAVTADLPGEYLAYVVGDCAFDYSRSADLSVHPPPQIVTAPQDASVCIGGAATFSVEADGVPPLQFQWQYNGSDIPGATDATYAIDSISPADLGQYRCVVTDGCGLTVASAAAGLTLPPDPMILTQPIGGTFCIGDTIFLFVVAFDAESFQWFKDGVPIPEATSAFFILSDVTQIDAGAYHVLVGGACTDVASDSVDVFVIDCNP